jgi:hypothetical protein
MSQVMRKLDEISKYTIELADRLAKRKKTVLALQLIEEIYRDISETQAKKTELAGDGGQARIEDRLLNKYYELKITGKQESNQHIYQRTLVQAVIVSSVVALFFLLGGYVATAYMKKQAKEVSIFVERQQEDFVDSLEKLKILSPFDLLDNIDKGIDEQKMAKLYAYLNSDPRLFFEVAKTYEDDGQLDLAITNLRRALLFDPDNEMYSARLQKLESTMETSD